MSDLPPPPGPGAPPGGEFPLTVWWRRLVATILDYVVIIVVLAIVLSVLGLSTIEQDPAGGYRAHVTLGGVLVTIAVTTLYFAIPTARTGRTLGKVALRCRVVRPDGRLVDLPGALLRSLAYALAVQTVVLAIVDGLWPLWDPRRQALHDKVADTVVVDG